MKQVKIILDSIMLILLPLLMAYSLIGESIHEFIPGGVCPFAVPSGIPVWLDVSMKRFSFIHPSAGNEFTSVKLTPYELEQASDAVGWCDVCKGWE